MFSFEKYVQQYKAPGFSKTLAYTLAACREHVLDALRLVPWEPPDRLCCFYVGKSSALAH